MHLEIVTPDRNLFRGEVDYLFCPGSNGAFGILNSHAPIIATLKAGKVKVKVSVGESEVFDQKGNSVIQKNEAGKELIFEIKSGVVEVLNNKVTLLAE